MKRLILSLAAGLILHSATAQTMNLIAYDSVVSLATNVTKNYEFIDTNGLSVTVAVTMTPYSSRNPSPAFTLLDFYGPDGAPVHVGVDSELGGGDGNWVDTFEGENFSATLFSADKGIVTNSIQLGIGGMGIRPNGGLGLQWASSTGTKSFSANAEQLWSLDSTGAFLADGTYAGQLSTPNGGQYQLSDNGLLAGQSLVFNVSFAEGTGSPTILSNPPDQSICSNNPAIFTAIVVGDPNPTAQWQMSTDGGVSFSDISNATNSTLIFTPDVSDSGNKYRAVFTNDKGVTNTTAATLTVNLPPSSTTIDAATVVCFNSSDNAATANDGTDIGNNYAWTITDGTITSATNLQTITYDAGNSGDVTLTVVVTSASGCSQIVSTNIPAVAGDASISAPSKLKANSTNNMASGVAGMASYAWRISNGTITSATNLQTITFTAGSSGTVTLGLTITSAGGCTASSSKSVIVIQTFTGAPGIYSTDDSGMVEFFDTNDIGMPIDVGYQEPAGDAFDASGNLYVVDGGAGTITQYKTNGTSFIFASGLNRPWAVSVDGAGNLFVTDLGNNDILEITTNGIIPVVAGDGISDPDGLAFDGAGNLYVASYATGTIFKCGSGGSSSVYASSIANASGMAFDKSGNLFVADYDDSQIWKIDTHGVVSVFANTNLGLPDDVKFDTAGNLYAANDLDGSITEFETNGEAVNFTANGLIGAEFISVWPPAPQLFPTNVISFSNLFNTLGSERIYVSSDNGTVEEFGTNGGNLYFAGRSGTEQGVALDRSGNVYVVDQANHLVVKYNTNAAGSVFTTDLNNPVGIAVDFSNNVFVSDAGGIEKFTPGGVKSNFWSSGGNLQAMSFDGVGNLYLADYSNNEILKFDRNGNSAVFATSNVNGPQGIAIDAAGNIYVANNSTDTIERYSPTGTDLGVFASTDFGPYGLAFDSATNLYVTTYADSIQQIAPDGTVSEFVSSYPNGNPAYLAIWPGLKPGGLAAAATLSGVKVAGHQFQFTISGTGGANYTVQATTNLASTNWVSVSTNAAPFTFIETNTSSYPKRFYRVISE